MLKLLERFKASLTISYAEDFEIGFSVKVLISVLLVGEPTDDGERKKSEFLDGGTRIVR